MHFKQVSVARKTNCFQEANIFVKPCEMRGGGEVGKGGPAPLVKHRAPHLVDPAQKTPNSAEKANGDGPTDQPTDVTV